MTVISYSMLKKTKGTNPTVSEITTLYYIIIIEELA